MTQAPICRAKTYPLREDLNDGFGAVSSECRMTRTGRSATVVFGGRDQRTYTSVCSAISSPSSTSIPRYLTVLSSFV